MKPIDEQYGAEPGPAGLDITGGDEDAVRVVMARLEERRATLGCAALHHLTLELEGRKPVCGIRPDSADVRVLVETGHLARSRAASAQVCVDAG
ncbi:MULTISPECIES: hypothetical protein [unclassified Streptomyces]|uniref:hypothetical protein n=1 Tax=unclassified Streptomyces TaxID=2593676 RepID=UPI0033264F2E